MGQNNILLYLIVFAVVFIPYLFLAFFINLPKKRTVDFKICNIPSFYRIFWPLISYFTESLGTFSEELQPVRKKKLQNALILANIKMDTCYVFAAETLTALISATAGALICMLITMDGFILVLAALVCGFAGYVIPATIIMSAADKRQQQIIKALPFSIDLIGSAIHAGLDFAPAVRYYVSTESSDNPLAVEFAALLHGIGLGEGLELALDKMVQRVQHDSFTTFAGAVIHGKEVGAPISQVMKIQAEEMRRVRFNTAERKAAKAVSSMIFPIAFFIMPAVFIIIGVPVLIRVYASGL